MWRGIDVLLSINRKKPENDYALFITAPEEEAQILSEVSLVPIAAMCQLHHKIVVRQVDSLKALKFSESGEM
ncbi:unnamed protein product [Cylicostephanus goldi]|uniref:Uncharacterized protein n=1 Tax=Cylicostephanus goldi TaxID=71465 RepID=A0A3P7Q9L3_CYLGO|nr:unnamed protein product [Cylicostephanus goldi]